MSGEMDTDNRVDEPREEAAGSGGGNVCKKKMPSRAFYLHSIRLEGVSKWKLRKKSWVKTGSRFFALVLHCFAPSYRI